MDAGTLLRDAAVALQATFEQEKDWDKLTPAERGYWGLRACPIVMVTLLNTKPQGYIELIHQVRAMADAWARSEGGQPTRPPGKP